MALRAGQVFRIHDGCFPGRICPGGPCSPWEPAHSPSKSETNITLTKMSILLIDLASVILLSLGCLQKT